MARDSYEVLGVRKNAEQDEIKRAYRSRSRALHPDVSLDPEADSRFRELSEAYAVLSRPESRRRTTASAGATGDMGSSGVRRASTRRTRRDFSRISRA